MTAALWLLRRALVGVATAGVVLATVAFLVDWVEALALALLQVPARSSTLSPVAAALGSAWIVAGMRTRGEWQGLAALGLGPGRCLLPFVLAGWAWGWATLSLAEQWGPTAALRQDQLRAAVQGGALAQATESWFWTPQAIFRLPSGGPTAPRVAEAFVGQGSGFHRWTARDLAWNGSTWVSEAVPQGPWALLPEPRQWDGSALGGSPARVRFLALGRDPRPTFAAEWHARGSRLVGCGPAAALGGLVPAILGPGSVILVLAVLPAASWEVAGSVAQVGAGQGTLPPWATSTLRLALAMVLLAAGSWGVRRPGRSG